MEVGQGIKRFMRTLLDDYKHLRGKSKESLGKAFWDVVVITTADSAQQEAFQLQICEKRERNELPVDLTIIVVSDPPGIRIGNGGSTLTALEHLEATYGDKLFDKKILMIHAGGWSQRMPSATILGKVFSLLPHGNPPYQMLDLKLALYWPFVDKISPGIFVVCADDFLVYSLDLDDEWKIPADGFTALAHPSPITVGRTHGVYVIKNVADVDTTKTVEIKECLEVLQKPSDERMKRQGALLSGSCHNFADGIHIDGEAVYTDSCFYFGTDITKKLLQFKKCVGDLSCEIDAYGDFLQAVGICASNSYIHMTSNVSQMTSNLLQMRQGVFDCLNGSDIHVLILNASAFIHIGTTRELLYHFCQDSVFQGQMAFEKDVFNSWNSGSGHKNQQNSIEDGERKIVGNDEKVSPNSCIMHSFINNKTVIHTDCVLDYCHFEVPIQVSSKCILSNCQLKANEAADDVARLVIPSGTFLHTVPIFNENSTKFVTVFFNIDDNLKKSVKPEDVESLPFLGSSVGHFMKIHSLQKNDVLPKISQVNQKESSLENSSQDKNLSEVEMEEKVSLWNLRLYSAHFSMTQSFEDALHSMLLEERSKCPKMSETLFSLADLLRLKDVKAMLSFRKFLYEAITTQVE